MSSTPDRGADRLDTSPGRRPRIPTYAAGTARGLVTDTISFSCVDGPGNRFVVFLQGCDFDCVACHNPYTIQVCTDCGECVPACPSGALSISDLGVVAWDVERCCGSERCIEVCPSDSTPKATRRSVDELLAAIRRAAPFLSGITVSGGEATQQAWFVHDLFAAVRADARLARLTCFIDTNGGASREVWDLLAPVTDGAMVDLKCLDPAIHERMTGRSNEPVLESIRYLHERGLLHEVRLLLVPGINDAPDLLERTARWLADVDPTMRVQLTGFRHHGVRPHDPPLVDATPASLDAIGDRFRAVAPFDLCIV